MCIEPGALKRPCCNALYCDHCYTKSNQCPNCGVGTKQEKLTKATFQMKIYSEHEECRVCLEPGLQRRCCNNYYCDTCYYKLTQCRSCGAQVGHLGDESKLKTLFGVDKAALATNCIGWLVTIFIALATAAFLAVVITAELETPVGLFDYKCYGFFRSCGVTMCKEMTNAVAEGEDPLPPLSSWEECDLDSEVKLRGKACIYDRLLYFQSERTMGYDICSDKFNEGVYIFEDTFEDWVDTEDPSTTRMASAKWTDVVNGITSDDCGVGEHFGQRRSLAFRGEEQRLAETQDLDVRSGGWLEFEMFMPPLGADTDNAFCRTGYTGVVFVEYSVNAGANWTTIEEYDPRQYRSSNFFKEQLEIPSGGITKSTRFRFSQPTFESPRDHWALDNVRVLRYLPGDWHNNNGFMKSLEQAQRIIQKAQCCLDTDWCSKRFNDNETEQCKDFFWYKGEDYLVRLSEILLCLTVLINILKFIYISIQDWYMKSRFPFQDEFLELLNAQSVQVLYKKYVPLRWRPRKLTPDAFSAQIHAAARMEQALREQYQDEEGEGEMLVRQEVVDAERRAAARKVRKARKRLEQRRQKKNFRGSAAVEEDLQEEELEEQKIAELQTLSPKPLDGGVMGNEVGSFNAEEKVIGDLERFQRQDHAMLRLPFQVECSQRWRNAFTACTLVTFSVIFLLELSYIKQYSIREPVRVYGLLEGEITLDSVLLVLFAAVCDFKEIFHTLKHIIPSRDRWVPQVTLDLTDEVRSLIVGNFVVPLAEVKEYGAFAESYVLLCAGCYALGVFPWCLFALLLREAVLVYSTMRIVTPFLGSVTILRAVLGPSFALKIGMSLRFLFDMNFDSREMMGRAFQSVNTRNVAVNTMLGMTLLTVLIASAVAFEWLLWAFLAAFVGGAIYGAFTGCMHDLPIRPWMCKQSTIRTANK